MLFFSNKKNVNNTLPGIKIYFSFEYKIFQSKQIKE